MTIRKLKKVNSKNFLKKILGDGFEEDLIKSEVGGILKQNANVSVLPQEMYVALQIVPRTVISMLVQHLKPLAIGQTADIPWPTDGGIVHNIHVNKISSDLYSGQITGEGKVITKFSYRSLPAVGLVVMSTYELYDKETNKQDLNNSHIDYDKVQKIIDERIRMQSLIEDVVNKKLSEREALQHLIVQKINDYLRTSEAIKQTHLPSPEQPDLAESEHVQETEEESQEPEVEDIELDSEVAEEVQEEQETKESKKSKLKQFLESKKVKKNEKISFSKNEISCPYCTTTIYKGGESINLCLCYGEDYGSSIKIKKNKDKEYVFKYPKNFSIDNANMLLSTIKKK